VVPIPSAHDVLVVGATGIARIDPVAGTTRLMDGELGTARGRTWLAVHPDGRRIFNSRGRGVGVFDLASGARNATLLGDTVVVDGFALTRDGARLLTWYAEAGTIKLWDTAAPHIVAASESHTRIVLTVAVDWRSRRAYTGSLDRDVRTWDVITGTPHAGALTHRSGQIAVHPDTTSGRLVTIGQDSTVTVYDAARTVIATFALNQYGDTRSVLLADGLRLVTGGGYKVDDQPESEPSNMHSLRLFEILTGEVVTWLDGHVDEVTAITAHPDPARIVSASLDGELRVWNVDESICERIVRTDCVPRSIAVHPDGDRVLIGGMVLSVWSLSQGRCLSVLGESGAAIENVACCPSGELALTLGTDRTACVWDLRTGMRLARWDGEDPFGAGAFGPGGHVILGDNVGTVTFLEIIGVSPARLA
jgi:WD40 repeat protein